MPESTNGPAKLAADHLTVFLRPKAVGVTLICCVAVLAAVPWARSTWAQALAADELRLKVGDAVPTLTVGNWIKGEPITELRKGQVYVVEFWATWCGPCRVSIPHLSKLQKQYKGVIFIGQSVREEDPAGVGPFVAEMGERMDYRVVTDDTSGGGRGKMRTGWLDASGQEGIPCAFVVGKDGRVAWIGHPRKLDAVLKAVVDGTFDVATEATAYPTRVRIQQRVNAAMETGDAREVLKAIDEGIAADPESISDYGTVRLSILVRTGRSADALQFARTLAEQLKDDPEELSSIAHQLLSPYASRDPAAAAFAMQSATQANERAGGRDPIVLNTLARAHFVQGNTAQAVETQRKAVEQAEDPQMKAQLMRILESYRAVGR